MIFARIGYHSAQALGGEGEGRAKRLFSQCETCLKAYVNIL